MESSRPPHRQLHTNTLPPHLSDIPHHDHFSRGYAAPQLASCGTPCGPTNISTVGLLCYSHLQAPRFPNLFNECSHPSSNTIHLLLEPSLSHQNVSSSHYCLHCPNRATVTSQSWHTRSAQCISPNQLITTNCHLCIRYMRLHHPSKLSDRTSHGGLQLCGGTA